MKAAAAYRKLIVAVAGVIAMAGHHQLGVDPNVIQPALVDTIIGVLTALGVWGLPNDQKVTS